MEIDDISTWLTNINMKDYIENFKEHEISTNDLLEITEFDLLNVLNIRKLGHVKHISKHIRFLRDSKNSEDIHESQIFTSLTNASKNQNIDPEIMKTLLSFVYCFLVFLLTAIVLVIVHDRTPDVAKYPPLPDMILDNLPLIPWAFHVAELCALLLFIILSFILVFHKHRFIILRRLFSMMGTIFLLRCFTMLLTSLSVPGIHLKCDEKIGDDLYSKLYRAFSIWKGMGMMLQGIRTCGDYMYSGHTCVLTLLNLFINEYSPRSFGFLHTTAWLLNIFGLFFILSSHEHYSIDVFIAFYITSRLFLYYHSLANNQILLQSNDRRTYIWFPLFAYFEAKCPGTIPNVYQSPSYLFKSIKLFKF